jgi:hypothetical protein
MMIEDKPAKKAALQSDDEICPTIYCQCDTDEIRGIFNKMVTGLVGGVHADITKSTRWGEYSKRLRAWVDWLENTAIPSANGRVLPSDSEFLSTIRDLIDKW